MEKATNLYQSNVFELSTDYDLLWSILSKGQDVAIFCTDVPNPEADDFRYSEVNIGRFPGYIGFLDTCMKSCLHFVVGVKEDKQQMRSVIKMRNKLKDSYFNIRDLSILELAVLEAIRKMSPSGRWNIFVKLVDEALATSQKPFIKRFLDKKFKNAKD